MRAGGRAERCTNCKTDEATVAGVGGEHLCEVCAHVLTCETCEFGDLMECSAYRRLIGGPMRYRTIVADPPWDMPDSGKRTQATNGGWADPKWTGTVSRIPYPRMSLDEITALPVREFAEKDAHLYVWTTNRFLRDTYGIVEAWGFKPSTLLTWCKAPMGLGMGGAFTLTTEFVLFARRGSLKPLQRMDSTWWQWMRGPHPKKPEAFLDMVERVSPGPYLELFARRNRLGWDTWGNEALNHIEVAT